MIITDTDVAIDILRRYPPAIQWIATVKEPVCLPGYVAFELFQGCYNKQQTAALQKQIAPFKIIWPAEGTLSDALAIYSSAHLTHAVGIIDALIAATALNYQLPLHTFNTKHFAAFPDLQTIQPYTR